MALHSSTRVAVDDSYAALVGKAIYVFAYYDWNIIYIINYLQTGFVDRYIRGKPMMSGKVKQEFQSTIDSLGASSVGVSGAELQACCDDFDRLPGHLRGSPGFSSSDCRRCNPPPDHRKRRPEAVARSDFEVV